jgi:MFS family permease
MASSGFGALISVLIIVPIVQSFKRNGRVMIIALFWIAAWLTVFAHSRSVTLSMLALCMGSMGAPTVMTVALGLVQLMSPPEMRGRLISLYTTISFGLQPLAALWIGQTAEIIGVETAIQLNAILLALGAGAMIIFRPTIMIYEYGTAKHEDVRYDAPDKPAVTSPTASPTTVVTDGPVLP